jgi:hypothetical protein
LNNAVEEVEPYNYPQSNTSTDDYRVHSCGFRNIKIKNRVKFIDEQEDSDNKVSEFAEFPWTLAVYEQTSYGQFEYKCGAVLVSDTIVLTAAHCTTNFKNNPEKYLIRAGDWNKDKTNERLGHQDRRALKIVRHPNFYSGSLFNNIAVILVDRPFDESFENVQRICIDDDADYSHCLISGWGGSPAKNVVPAIQNYLSVSLMDSRICEASLQQSRLGKRFRLHENFLCARGDYSREMCKGVGGNIE